MLTMARTGQCHCGRGHCGRQYIQGVFGLLSMVWLCTTIYLFTSVSLPTPSREYDSKTNIDKIDNMILSDTSRTLQQQGTHHDNNGIGTDKSNDTTNTEMTTVSNHDHVNLTDEKGNPGPVYVHNATTLHDNPALVSGNNHNEADASVLSMLTTPNQKVDDSPYTTDALQRNPYLGWQPPQHLMQQLNFINGTATNFSWVDCLSSTTEYTGKAPDKDGSNQPLGCLERPSQLGNVSFSVEKFNETSWIPDITMLRTMLMHGKDRDGHPYPAQLPKELCRDFIISSDQNSTIDEDKRCFKEANIKPTGPLNASTVTIFPWNHFGVSHNISDENKTSITVPAPKVLCLIYTVKNSHSTSIRAIRDTWGGGCDGFLAFSSSPDPRLPAIALQHEGPESYDNMWQKVRSIWKYVGAHYLDEFDWFFIGGDDMFVLPNNLRTYLASLAYKDGNADPRLKEYYVGRRFYSKEMEQKLKKKQKFPKNAILHFNTGGSGYALSHATLRKFLTVVDDVEHCSSDEKTSAEDVMMAKCLHHLGIRVTDSRDRQGRERFHMFMPGRLYNWNIAQKKNWYYRFNPWGLKNKADCCAPDTVSFHYAKQPAMVRHLHALLYHCSSSDSTYAETAH